MNFFTYKIDKFREKIITMQPPTTVSVSHQAVHCSLPEEKIDSFIGIREKRGLSGYHGSDFCLSKGNNHRTVMDQDDDDVYATHQ